MSLANIALPLTNSFIGEFMMFNGLFSHNIWMAGVALISIILAAVYTLWMVQKVFYGEVRATVANALEVSSNAKLMLVILVVIVVAFGVYPKPLLDLTNETVKLVAQIK